MINNIINKIFFCFAFIYISSVNANTAKASELYIYGKPVDIVNNSLLSLGTQDAPQDYARLVPEDKRSSSDLDNPELIMSKYQPWYEKMYRQIINIPYMLILYK